MFVPPTRGSVLVRSLQAIERKNTVGRDWGVKVLKRRGPTVASQLCAAYPWRNSYCEQEDCIPCSTADKSKPPWYSCRTPGVGYVIRCLTCKQAGQDSTYQGETGGNAYSRGLEHMRDMRNNIKNTPMVSHQTTHHRGLPYKFSMTVSNTFRDAMSRQLEEAHRIEQEGPKELNMNSRAEWRSTPLPQIVITQGRVPRGTVPVYHAAPAGQFHAGQVQSLHPLGTGPAGSTGQAGQAQVHHHVRSTGSTGSTSSCPRGPTGSAGSTGHSG